METTGEIRIERISLIEFLSFGKPTMASPINYIISSIMRYTLRTYFCVGQSLLVIFNLVLDSKNKDDLQLKSNKGCFSAIDNAFNLRLWDHVWQYQRDLKLGSVFIFSVKRIQP